MHFYADLHIHSKYSRATSRDCDLENLAYWGRKKGITVIGTGDFTHPAWIAEIKAKLVPAEPGLFRLKEDIEKAVFAKLPPSCRGPVRFMLSVEISTIYKKGDKTRKVHHLVYAPSIEKAEAINKKLGSIGNIRSDGRPILGLDSRHLLEIVLNAGEDCYLVPAHIWTPWFSVLGSKSGFDKVSECYGDLADHVFAVETGLSSDPEMNWRVSHLDRYRLVSNSDAHSPQKLGREACVFETDMDYYSMRSALQTGKGYGGTAEFFPEEGKYHLDGHRKCDIRLWPEESRKLNGFCPVCKKPLTLGVMYRVEELASRPICGNEKPKGAADFKSLVPLPEMISEIVGVGPASNKVEKNYEQMLFKLGPELEILNHIPEDEIKRAGSSLLTEAISRMRRGQVIRDAGYDGEYGKIRLFKDEELKQRTLSASLFPLEESPDAGEKIRAKKSDKNNFGAVPLKIKLQEKAAVIQSEKAGPLEILSALDPDQRAAVSIVNGPLLIVAGPGSGKTRTLTHRVAHLVRENYAGPEQCLTITFTRRAAEEMRGRLKMLLPDSWQKVPVLTFHGLAFRLLQENRASAGLPHGFRVVTEEERMAWLSELFKWSPAKAVKILRKIAFLKRESNVPEIATDEASAWTVFENQRDKEGWLDYDDLIAFAVKSLEEDKGLAQSYRRQFPFISIDEYQDVDEWQYRLVRCLAPEDGNLCVIGDPDQSIYGFRGSDVGFFLRFEQDFPGAKKIRLTRNYRSGESILSASFQMIAPSSLVDDHALEAILEDTGKVMIYQAPTDKAEAEFVVENIEKSVGGASFFSVDSGRATGSESGLNNYSFSDFAVLYRTEAQADVLEEALERSGLPFRRFSQQHVIEGTDGWDERADRIALLTLHAAKGLEFSVVFITGCEDGLIPLRFGAKNDEKEIAPAARQGQPVQAAAGGLSKLAEERRLFYVGMTRAKDRLFLSHAAKRFWNGKVREQQVSPFLQDIEEKLLERKKSVFKARKRSEKSQFELF